ncbi:hypothetical protein SLE2022_015210 [Rubroshorea leprosula]
MSEEERSCALWFLQVAGLLIFLALCIFLALLAKSPTFTILDFSIPTTSNCSINEECGDIIIPYLLEIRNPNKDSDIYYDDISVIFYHEQDVVGSNTIPSFHQGKNKKKKVSSNVNGDPLVWRTLRNAMLNATAKQLPKLNVNVLTKIKYKTWGKLSKHHGIHKHASFTVGKDGRIPGKKKIKLVRASKKR